MTSNRPKSKLSKYVRKVLRVALPIAILVTAVWSVAVIADKVKPRPVTLQAARATEVNIQTQTVQSVDQLADTILLPGRVQPHKVVKISAEVPGRVEFYAAAQAEPITPVQRLRVLLDGPLKAPAGQKLDEGDPVRQDQPVMALDDALIRAEVAQSQAQVDYDRRELERLNELRKRNVATPNEVDLARTQLRIHQAQLDRALERLKRTIILAESDGTLNRIHVEEGEYVREGEVVAEIVITAKVTVAIDAPEQVTMFLRAGRTQATVYPLGSPQVGIDGVVTYVDAQADPVSLTTPIEVTLDNRAGLFRTGQIVNVRLTRRVLPDVVMVPLAAVIPMDDQKVVYVVQDGRAVQREVTLGMFQGQDVQILSGLAPGEELIVRGHRYVGPGSKVKLRNDFPTTQSVAGQSAGGASVSARALPGGDEQ